MTVAPMECHNSGGNSKGHIKHQVDCLKAHITICASKRKLAGKSLTPGQEVPSRTTRGCLNSGVLSAMKQGYQSLKFV